MEMERMFEEKKKTILVLTVAIMMIGVSLGMIPMHVPAGSTPRTMIPDNAPSSSLSNTAYLNATMDYWQNVAIANTGTTTLTLNAVEASSQQTASISSTSSWSVNSGKTVGTISALGGSYQVWISQVNIGTSSNPDVVGEIASGQLYSIAFTAGEGDSSGTGVYNIGTLYCNLTVDGFSYSSSHTFNNEWTAGSGGNWVEASPSWAGIQPTSGAGPVNSGYYTASLQVQVTSYNGYVFDTAPVDLYTYSGSSGTESSNVNEPSGTGATIGFITGWTYSGQSVSSSFSPSDLTSFDITWSTTQTGALSYNGFTYTSSPVTGVVTALSVSFNSNGADPNVLSYKFSYYLSSQVQAQSSSLTQSSTSSQNPSQVVDWWNSSMSYSLSPPSGALDNPSLATTSGTLDASTTASWTVAHILSAGYNTGALTDLMNVSGHRVISAFAVTQEYQIFTDSAVVNAALAVNYFVDEYIAYEIAVTPTPPDLSAISQSPVNFSLVYSSQIALTEISLYVSGSLEDRYTSVGTSGTVSYSFVDPTFSPESVQWILTTGEYTQYVNLSYGGVTTPSENSSSIIVFQSATATLGFPITLSGVPGGSGYWDQQFTFNTSADASLMAGLNTERTNYKVELPGGTNVYSWVSSSSSTSVTLYAQLPNGTSSVFFNVYPLFENFSSPSRSVVSATTTYSVGAGAPFMANATTISSFTGSPGRNYNYTYQTMTYDIPIAPTTKYVSAVLNSTWQFAGLYPSTYQVQERGQQVLFSNISGFGAIQVSTVQPSQSLGQLEPISLTYLQLHAGSTIGYQYYSDFTSIVTYVPFGSSKPITFTPGSADFDLPYGAHASVQVLDYWHELVGSISFLVLDQSMQENIRLNVTSVTFLVNGTLAMMSPGSVSIQSGNYNLTGANPEYIANGSSYVWYASALDPQTSEMVLYSGIVKANTSNQRVIVPVGAPVSTLIVNVEAYSGSGIGQLGNGGPATGNPTAILKIDGATTLLGTSFVGIKGQTYNITVYDVLGHLLLQKNITLESPVMPETLNISLPSYIIGFVNDEAINASSPLATQTSDLSELNGSAHYSFTTHVGQESEIYLVPGRYHLYTHDNLTNALNITLTNQSLYYSFNGQNISRITGNSFNYSSMQLFGSIYAPMQEANKTGKAIISLYIQIAGKETLLTQSQTQTVMKNMTVDILLDGNFLKTASFVYISPGMLSVPLNLSTLSTQYTINLTVRPSLIDGKSMEFQTGSGFSVVNYNPANPPSNANNLAAFLTSIPMEILYAILAIGEVINIVWKRLRRDDEERDESVDQAGTVIEAMIALKVINKEPLSPAEQAIWAPIDQRTKDKLIMGLTSGHRRVFVFKVRRRIAGK